MLRTLSAISMLALVPAVLVAGSSLPASSAPAAKAAAHVTVTIKAEGVDLSGQVKSTKKKCKANRTVVVIKQKGKRGGDDDTRFASDTTDLQNGKYVWSTGNTGTPGRFYAKVAKKPGCSKDSSPTIRATRNP
jgi:hypothetical protein